MVVPKMSWIIGNLQDDFVKWSDDTRMEWSSMWSTKWSTVPSVADREMVSDSQRMSRDPETTIDEVDATGKTEGTGCCVRDRAPQSSDSSTASGLA